MIRIRHEVDRQSDAKRGRVVSLTVALALGLSSWNIALRPALSEQASELWRQSVPIPVDGPQLPDAKHTSFHVIKSHQPKVDQYDWLHGVAIAWHRNQLFASFGHNFGKENTATEVANYVVSNDGGATWSDLRHIDRGVEQDLAVSHGVFLSIDEKLWAFHGAFYGAMQRVHTRAYVFDQAAQMWHARGVILQDGFWPMQEPQKMADGNWVMAGLRVIGGIGDGNNPAAIAISKADDLLNWTLVTLPRPSGINMWGESTVLIDGTKLLNISRYRKPIALVSRSSNFGKDWSPIAESNLPMAASKPYAGRLSNGQYYLIGNTTAANENRRFPLTIAVSNAGESTFSAAFRIRGATHPGPGESHRRAALSYPYAIEHEGKLYISYSNDGGRGGNRNSAELAIVPISDLKTE